MVGVCYNGICARGWVEIHMILRLAVVLLLTGPLFSVSATETVVVFPFENRSGRSDLVWISESFSETLQSRLISPRRYAISREERMQAYQALGLPAVPGLTLASLYKMARSTEADWIVTGSFQWDGQILSAQVRLVDVKARRLRPALREQGRLEELLEIQLRLAWALWRELDPGFAMAKKEFVRRAPRVKLDAFENFIRGLLADDWDEQVSYFTRAYQLDPHDHRSAFELGRVYFGDKKYSPSLAWLRKLKPGHGRYWEAFFLRGIDHFLLEDYGKAESTFRKLAEEIQAPEVSNNLGLLRARSGHPQEALELLGRAYELDSSDPDLSFNLAVMFWQLGDFERAAHFAQESVRLREDDTEARNLAARIHARNNHGKPVGESRETTVGTGIIEGKGDKALPGERPDFQLRIKVEYDPRSFHRWEEDSNPPRATLLPGGAGPPPPGQRFLAGKIPLFGTGLTNRL